MPEELLRLLAFIVLGIIVWALARRFPMDEYGPQPVEPFDRWFLAVALALGGAVDVIFGPALNAVANGLYAWAAPARQAVAGWSVTTQVLVYLITTDFLGYWAHRLMHSSAVWRIHAMHHSARSLNWFSGMRGTPMDMVFILAPGALMAPLFLLTESHTAFFILLFIQMASEHLTHSNLRLPFVRQLEWFLVTPRMHFIHHHRDMAYGNSNYGFYFSIWDHLFGTYIDSDDVPDKGPLGLMEDYTMKSLFLGVRLTEPAPEKGRTQSAQA
ncbi:MAG: sterol desaturase family protein [Proteobacteria bacterium]|nr:sterol desaturase family protein [Pseudomonadota bacterium]